MNPVYIINERGPDFWGTHHISSKTTYGKLEGRDHKILSQNDFQEVVEGLKNKKVLVYIHGLRTTKEEIYESYNLLKQNLVPTALNQSYYEQFKNIAKYYLGFSNTYEDASPYDIIIGYSWPSFDHEAHYYSAKEHAVTLAPKLAGQLHKISKTASKVDIMAHSMGNLVLLEALSKHADPDLSIDHVYSVAPAVPDTSLNHSGSYSKALEVCNYLFVFHSIHDAALGWPYFMVENQTYALGLLGPNQGSSQNLHHKIKVIDSSAAIGGHSEYFHSDDFYQYVSKIHNKELDFDKTHFKLERSQKEEKIT